jgi:hypothetical protein
MELLSEWVMWNLISIHLETMLVLVQYRCMVYTECTIGSEIVLDAPSSTLGDKDQIEARFSPFADSANLNAILVHYLRQTYHRLRKCFGRTRWNP